MPTAEYFLAENDHYFGDAAHDLDWCVNPSQLGGSRPETPSALDAAIWPLPGEERP